MRIAIEARLPNGRSGGIQQVVIGLALGLSQLDDAGDRYIFVVEPEGREWLSPHIAGQCSLHVVSARRPPFVRQLAKRVAPPGVLNAVRKLRGLYGRRDVRQLPRSDGAAESAGAELLHFPYQAGYVTELPTIYHPHDLQHLHLPSYFTADEIAAREFFYRAYCDRASLVAVTSSWIKADIAQQYGVPSDKIAVVPLAPINESDPLPSAGQVVAVRGRLKLDSPFVLYPAQTWPHKNHVGLLRAIDLIISEGRAPDITLVFSGFQTDFASHILRVVEELSLRDRVRFLGYIAPEDLRCVFHAARCVVVPSLFEAASFPIWEAFVAGTPVACSNVTSLPAQAGDAALIFDPNDPRQIADAVARLWTDEQLRLSLVQRGRVRVSQFSWLRTARTFRAHYRRLLGAPMSDEDARTLEARPLL